MFCETHSTTELSTISTLDMEERRIEMYVPQHDQAICDDVCDTEV